jgi:hypothetical protein
LQQQRLLEPSRRRLRAHVRRLLAQALQQQLLPVPAQPGLLGRA